MDTMELEKDFNDASNDSKVSNDSNKENKTPQDKIIGSPPKQQKMSLFEANTRKIYDR